MTNPAPRFLDPVFVDALMQGVGTKFFTVEFAKVNGEIRVAHGRLNVESRMAHNELSDPARERMAKAGQVPFYDFHAKSWKSFKRDRVIAIKCGATDNRA